MSSNNTFAKNYLYYRIVGYGLYGVSGWLAFCNAKFTMEAYNAQGLPGALPLLAAVGFTLIQAGATIFLLSPDIWGELTLDFGEQINQGINPFRGIHRIIAGIIIAIIVVGVLSLTVASVYADWTSTAKGLGLRMGDTSQDYLYVLALVLVLGSEVCTMFAHQVLRLGKRHAVAQMAESSQLDPALIYSSEHLRAAKAAAKARAKAAGEHWGQVRQ